MVRDGSTRRGACVSRSIPLPEGVDENAVSARFDHGVPEVTVPLPQSQRSRGRRVQIQSGAAPGARGVEGPARPATRDA